MKNPKEVEKRHRKAAMFMTPKRLKAVRLFSTSLQDLAMIIAVREERGRD
jgi:hypothetical protein